MKAKVELQRRDEMNVIRQRKINKDMQKEMLSILKDIRADQKAIKKQLEPKKKKVPKNFLGSLIFVGVRPSL